MRTLYTGCDLLLIFLQNFVVPVACMLGLGIWKGPIAIITLAILKWLLLKICCPQLETLTTIDEFFLLDWDKNRSNILTLMKLDKIHDADAFM